MHDFGRSAINVAKYKKSLTTLVYAVLAFSLCFFPYVISVVIYFGFGNRTSETYSAYRVTVVFVFLSSAINPVLYLWRMDDIRNGVRELFCAHAQERVVDMMWGMAFARLVDSCKLFFDFRLLSAFDSFGRVTNKRNGDLCC